MSGFNRSENIDIVSIDAVLKDIGLPGTKQPYFYILKFDDLTPYLNDVLNNIVSHKQDYFEITFLSGFNADIIVEDQKSNTEGTNLCFFSPNQVINWVLKSMKKDNTGYTIFFKPEIFPFTSGVYSIYKLFPFFYRNTKSIYSLSNEQKEPYVSLMENMYSEFVSNSEDSRQFIISYLTLLLFTAKREFDFKQNLKFKRTRPEEITLLFENLIQNSTQSRQSVEYYAGELNISTVYLSECIKKTTGKTAKQIIDEYLVIEAKSIIRYTNKSISEISFELGFSDKSNFGRYFKKHTGISPLEYRKA